MLEHFKGDEVFVKKILDYKYQAELHQRMILTPFYDPHKQDIVRKVIGHDLQVVSYGGFLNSESQRMIICPSFYEINHDDFEIVVVEVVYQAQFGLLKHKDILGALMNLGIKRECIGDIDDQGPIYFACNKQTYPYILQSLTQIKRSKIHLKEVNKELSIVHQTVSKVFFLSSLRLDKVVSAMYRISRAKASEAIRRGDIKVNHKEVEEVNYLCHNNDIISFKKHGRVQLLDEGKKSRQDYHIVNGIFYK